MLFHQTKCFVSPSASIICKNKIKVDGFLIIGKHCIINALSNEGIRIGNGVSIGRETSIECTGSIEIGDNTIVGIYVTMHSENHTFSNINRPIREQGVNHKGIKIGKNCWIGAKAIILDGSVVGDGCIVAAGAVVTGKFPDNCIIGGVPAKIIKYRD